MVKRGNEERGGDLGHLIGGGGGWGAAYRVRILRLPFCAFVFLNETVVGLGECL